MDISRVWAMPSRDTFAIKPIRELVGKYLYNFHSAERMIIDPFVGNSPFKWACVSNDLDPEIAADAHMDALDFLKSFDDNSVFMTLYDPPYSVRQVSEVYRKMDMTVNMETTQASYWTKQKKEITRITLNGGYVIKFGWNSGGIGKTNGFELVEILLVPHGGVHNDTIVTVERKFDTRSN